MIGLFYFLLIILASTLGSIAGIGGGVIIKPLMDALHFHSVSDISFFSSLSVFTMSVVSVFRRLKMGIKVQWSLLVTLILASVLGGFVGHAVFEYLLHLLAERSVLLLQIIVILATLIFSLWATRKKLSLGLKSLASYLFAGAFLGFLSSFLGIGGGPINVAFLLVLFGLTIQEATLYSLIIIFFSQFSHLFSLGFSPGFASYDLSLVPIIVPASILGALIGSYLMARLSSNFMNKCFNAVLVGVIIINLTNLVRFMLGT